MSVLSVKFEKGELRVVERVQGYDLVPGGAPVPCSLIYETVTTDKVRILEFFRRVRAR